MFDNVLILFIFIDFWPILEISISMIIRIQSCDGTKRVNCSADDSLLSLFKKIEDLFGLNGKEWKLFFDRSNQKQVLVPESSANNIESVRIKHGDMMFLVVKASDFKNSFETTQSTVVEDAVDVELWKRDGRIKHCHNDVAMFKVENLSTEPWDETYLREKQIKFMSFHAYMRQQTAGVDMGKYFKLETIKAACKLNTNGSKHSAVELPSAVTLNRQKFRHVDNVMFENQEIVDRFLNYWRISGNQRIGFLYGKYSPHADVPLGIKAEVCAIYEPPQVSTPNSLHFTIDPNEEVVEHIANKLGLQKVGWILTDLVAEQKSQGIVKNIRNANTHFLSAEECITAATFQNKYPNKCRLASKGSYGSKFVTVVISGDTKSQISFEGYQVSNQCMSLVGDDCLIPTIDAPELGYIRESTPELFVSDVYYKEKDEYGNEIIKLARPLPLEYLLIDVPTAFSIDTQFTSSNRLAEFPISNRYQIGHVQSLASLAKYMKHFDSGYLVDALSDFHVLLYLATNDTIPLKNEMDILLDAIRLHDNQLATHWSECASWSTLTELMKHTDEVATATGIGNVSGSIGMDADMREAIERSLQMS